MRAFVVALLLYLGMTACQGEARPPAAPRAEGLAEAVFAGGCFWCTEHDFEAIPGVAEAISGYTGGHLQNPSYEDVITETTGHYEAVIVRYDPAKISYGDLVERFWRMVDPTDAGGQFCDRGPSYATAIFVADAAQRRTAEESKRKLKESGRLKEPVVTPVLPLGVFYPAEDYHQDYSEKNPVRYRLYRTGCGRDRRLQQLWGAVAANF